MSLWEITFNPLKNGLRKYSSMKQNLVFFHQKYEGIAFTFCRYLYQNMRASIFCMYCPPIVFCPQIWKTKKSSKIEGNTLGILRRSFFPSNALGMPSFNNSVLNICQVKHLQQFVQYYAWESFYFFSNWFWTCKSCSLILHKSWK